MLDGWLKWCGDVRYPMGLVTLVAKTKPESKPLEYVGCTG